MHDQITSSQELLQRFRAADACFSRARIDAESEATMLISALEEEKTKADDRAWAALQEMNAP